MAVFTGITEVTEALDERVFVIDLEDPTNVCKNLANVPLGVTGASGILFDNSKPFYCGGFVSGVEIDCECFVYEQNEWVSVGSMQTCRRNAASTVLVNHFNNHAGFVIAGGENPVYLSAVEYFDGSSWHNLSSLPEPIYGGCMVAINETFLISIGGYPYENVTYFYNSELNEWLDGPELQEGRGFASCASVNWKNPADGKLEQVIVVAGGVSSFNISSVELLYIDDISLGWQPGPELPKSNAGSVLVEYKESVVLVGGFGEVDGKHLYQLSSQDGPWIEMEQTLPIAKTLHIAFLIPDELTDCQQA